MLLGLRNILRVSWHRMKLKLGWRPKPIKSAYPGSKIFTSDLRESEDTGFKTPVSLLGFGWYPLTYFEPPNWHADIFGVNEELNAENDWVHYLGKNGVVDPKRYWELSRFDWLPQLALDARSGDESASVKIDTWLNDWVCKNPIYKGINWGCGQEAGIRLINLALSNLILNSWSNPTEALKWIIEVHANRIDQTLSYALGQDNNHGTVEACALFIAGTWGKSWSMPGAAKIAQRGKKWLNERALRVIQIDGSPCQYSTTYHRVNLEVLCMAELWSKRTGARGLNAEAAERVVEGTRWLHAITDSTTGDVPNMGANDGSHLFCLSKMSYRDFRPTVALAAALFANAKPWVEYEDPRIEALGLSVGNKTWLPAVSRTCMFGGFHMLHRKKSMALMHYPRFRFRPSQADALHVDLWHDGVNLLRDAGSYHYNAEWFSGTSAHNTIEFDGRNQMPRLGRFLFGDWLKADAVEPVKDDGVYVKSAAAYTDRQGARHHRAITLSEDSFICHDEISGNFEEACLRWRLAPGHFHLEDNIVRNEFYSVSIEFNGLQVSPVLGTSMESRYYLQKTESPQLSVKVCQPGILTTRVAF